MQSRIIDLHVHSTESDGTYTPRQLVLAAKKAGLSAFALTDHDTTAGVKKAADIAAEYDIELISGIELSTQYELPTTKKQSREIHIVGLFIDPSNPTLLEKTAEFRANRDSRNEKIVTALQKEGFAITMEQLLAENPNSVITRANIARYLYTHGMIKSVQEAFDKYIGDGCKCYVGRFKITPMEAVTLIHTAGGIAILAHPLLYHLSTETLRHLIDDLKAVGLDGIEAIYSTYTTGEEQFVKRLAREYQLLVSGGSDFHGENKPMLQLGTGRGHLYVPYELLDEMKKRIPH